MAKKNLKNINNVSKPMPPTADVRNTIKTPFQLYRVQTDLLTYRNAVLAAENILNPQRYRLYQVYKSIELDAHLSAAVQQRKNLILCREYEVKTKSGEEDENKTKIIRSKWFIDFLSNSLDSIFYGHSLIQFESLVNDAFKCVELVPRIYVKPELHIVTIAPTAVTGIDYLDDPYNKWCIGVGDRLDLGLYLKAAPLVIWKKNALGAWAEFIEKFGSPIRIGKTDANDLKSVNAMEDMLKNLGQSAYGIFRTDDQIELIESQRQDAYNVFEQMIARCNTEISKLILGETATMDEKSFVGSAEVHERVLESLSDTDEYFIYSVLNTQLVPLLIDKGLLSEGDTICSEEDDELSLVEKSKIDIEFIKTGKFTMTPEYIKEKYNTELIAVSEPNNTITSVKNALDELYK